MPERGAAARASKPSQNHMRALQGGPRKSAPGSEERHRRVLPQRAASEVHLAPSLQHYGRAVQGGCMM